MSLQVTKQKTKKKVLVPRSLPTKVRSLHAKNSVKFNEFQFNSVEYLSLQQIDQDDGVLNFACNFRLQCILNLGLLQIDQVIEYSISLLAFDRSKSVLLTFWMERSTATTLNLITVYTNRQFCQTHFNQLLIHFLSHVPQTKLVAY